MCRISFKKLGVCLAILFSVFIMNLSNLKVFAAATLTVNQTIDNNKVTFKVSDTANLNDTVSILIMQKGTNSMAYMDQGKLMDGKYTFSTLLPKGDYSGYVSSSSIDNVALQDFTIAKEEKLIGYKAVAPINAALGGEVVLPNTVIGIFDDGANRILAVTWSSSADTTKEGKQTVSGTTDGYDAKASIEINVGDKVYSTDATLSSIKVNGTALADFAAEKISYNLVLPAGTTKVPEVIGIVNAAGKAKAVVTSASILPGATTIIVTAEEGKTQKTYTINFTVAQPSNTGGNGALSYEPAAIPPVIPTAGDKNIIPVQAIINSGTLITRALITIPASEVKRDRINEVTPVMKVPTSALEFNLATDSIRGGKGSLLLNANNLTMDVPFSILDFSSVQPGTSIKFEQVIFSDDNILKGLKGAKKVYSFSLGLYSSNGTRLADIHTFKEGKIKLSLKFTEEELKNLDKSKLAFAYYNEQSKNLEYIGGSFNSTNNTLEAELPYFSKYAIVDMSTVPVFEETATQNVEQGNFLQFKVKAGSANNMRLTYTTSNLPVGATFDAAKQTLNWTPNVDQAGSYTISFNVTDGLTTTKKEVTVVVKDVPVSDLVEKALVEKDFYHFNIAYYKVVKLSDETAKATELDKLGKIQNLVWNDEIKNINRTLKELASTGSGRIYEEVQTVINGSKLSAVDKGYLLGEVTSWGKRLVFTEEYKNAVDALANAWTKLDSDSVSKAEKAIEKVNNKYSKEYLLEEFYKVKAKMK